MGGKGIFFTQPTSQIDQFAAGTAKRPIGPLLRTLVIHFFIADWAPHFTHRIFKPQDLLFFPELLLDSLELVSEDFEESDLEVSAGGLDFVSSALAAFL